MSTDLSLDGCMLSAAKHKPNALQAKFELVCFFGMKLCSLTTNHDEPSYLQS